MKQSSCYLCKSQDFIEIANRTRDIKNIKVLKCNSCGLVFLSSFEHIKKNFYKNSQMHKNILSISEWTNETEVDDERRYQALKGILKGKRVLDFGAGNCNFLSKISFITKQSIGVEPEEHIRKQTPRNVKVYEDISNVDLMKFDVITMFHVIEHLPNPKITLSKLCNLLTDEGQIIIETPNANDALITLYENKAFMDFTYWGCHLFLYNHNTLEEVANQSNLSSNYINQIQRYSLGNHLHWLAKGEPDGHKYWAFFISNELNNEYVKQLAFYKKCDTLMGSFSRKKI